MIKNYFRKVNKPMPDIDVNDKNYHVKELLIRVIENEISEFTKGYATADMKEYGSADQLTEKIAKAVNDLDDKDIKDLGGFKAANVGNYIYIIPDKKRDQILIHQ